VPGTIGAGVSMAGAIVAVVPVLVSALAPAAQYSWFIGMAVGLVVYTLASRRAR